MRITNVSEWVSEWVTGCVADAYTFSPHAIAIIYYQNTRAFVPTASANNTYTEKAFNRNTSKVEWRMLTTWFMQCIMSVDRSVIVRTRANRHHGWRQHVTARSSAFCFFHCRRRSSGRKLFTVSLSVTSDQQLVYFRFFIPGTGLYIYAHLYNTYCCLVWSDIWRQVN